MTDQTVEGPQEKRDWGKLFGGIGKEVLKDMRTAAAVCVGILVAGYIQCAGTPDGTPPAA